MPEKKSQANQTGTRVASSFGMDALDRLIPLPRLLETDAVEITAPIAEVWDKVRHGDLGRTPLIRALFGLRGLPGWILHGERPDTSIRIAALRSTPEQPGFQMLADDAPHELAVGAIGQVWMPEIPFVHVADASAFAAFSEAPYIKVAWALQLEELAPERTRLGIEVRVDATDDVAWNKFRHYFLLIGPASRFIRRSALSSLARELGKDHAAHIRVPGDELLPDAAAEVTHEIVMRATPQAIWPWLVQMGCDRAGFYSIDMLDNANARSAREVHPEWQGLAVGDRIALTPDGSARTEVLQLEAAESLVLGSLFDPHAEHQLPFAGPRPARYWHVTWAFALIPEADGTTRLRVRARAAFSPDAGLHARLIRPVHTLMEQAQLHHLRARVEGRLPRDDARDVLAGVGGALRIGWELVSPFARARHKCWGIDPTEAAEKFPGDDWVPEPTWSYTHAIDIGASAEQVWPWLAQIGATRAGFYSYQWLENVVGCEVKNAETVHPEWEAKLGDALYVHPSAPPLKVVALERGSYYVAQGAPDEAARIVGEPWVGVSWLFYIQPRGNSSCRVLSRYRAAHSQDLATRLSFGPSLLLPISFAMDRRMLLGLRERAERATPTPR